MSESVSLLKRRSIDLLYTIELGSTIHPEHLDVFHKGNFNVQNNYWTTSGADISIEERMDFDPYLGRVVNPSQQAQQAPQE